MGKRKGYAFSKTIKDRYFKFNSKGPKGVIEKVIIFQDTEYLNRYNLAFGDIIDDDFDDTVKSGNRDVFLIIGTVVNSIYHFLEKYPESQIEFSGSDPQRNRFYAMILEKYYSEIIEEFYVYGMIDDKNIEPIDFSRKYKGYLIQKRRNK